MAATFLELLSSIARANSHADKEKLSQKIFAFLKEDASLSAVATITLVNAIIAELKEMNEMFQEEDFVKTQSRCYKDYDGKHKIALGVSFIQDYRQHNEELPSLILEALCSLVMEKGLELVVNDITVNHLQMRDFSANSML